jgi:hypothetical protein
MPRDPEGTFERVRGGTIRAGLSENGPWTRVTGDGDGESGIEVELLKRFANELGAKVEWTHGSEGDLLQSLHRGRLDVVVGGLTDSTPWAKQVGLTQPYVTVPAEGRDEKHVIAVAPGENRWLLELDRFLQRQRDAIRRMLAAEPDR